MPFILKQMHWKRSLKDYNNLSLWKKWPLLEIAMHHVSTVLLSLYFEHFQCIDKYGKMFLSQCSLMNTMKWYLSGLDMQIFHGFTSMKARIWLTFPWKDISWKQFDRNDRWDYPSPFLPWKVVIRSIIPLLDISFLKCK